MHSLHSGSSACLKFKAQTLDVQFAFWVFCLPKVQAQTLEEKFAFWVFCLPKNSRPKPWMQSLHSGSSACLKSKAQTLDAKFAFWVFCLPKKYKPKPWMQSLHSGFCLPKIQGPNLGSSACLKFKAQALDAKFAFWVFCLPKIQGPNLGCQVCILGLLPASNPRPKPWMHSLHSGSSACLKIQAQTLDATFAFWVFCLPEIQGPNFGCKVCIQGLLPA